MAEFKKLVITTKGQALMAKMMVGAGSVAFTKIAVSDTDYEDDQLEGLASLSSIKQSVLVSKVIRTNNVAVQIEAALTNSELTTGYYMRTVGLYALDPDDGEILYAAANSNIAGYMPPYNGISTSGAFFQLVTTVGNTENVSLEINPSATATIGDIQELQNQISDLQAFIGYTDNEVYGVEVDFVNKRLTRLAGAVNRTPGDMFDNIKAFGGRRRCNVTNAGEVVAYYGDAGYSETGKLTTTVTVGEGDTAKTYAAGTIVQVMVEQPKFYYKVVPLQLEKIADGNGFHMRKARYYVSDTMKIGFKLHPAFKSNGQVKNFIYLAAYEACLWDVSASAYILDDSQVADFAADMVSSIANVKPMSGLTQNLTRNNVRLMSQKRGTGWQQSYVYTVSATQMLFLIEYASFDMQTHIGYGLNGKTDDGATSMTEITGSTAILGNKTGSVTNTNGLNVVSYRGEENLYGNIWTFVDGININANGIHEAYVSDYNFADRKIDGNYQYTGFTIAKVNGYVSAFGYNEDFDWMFMPSETLGNTALPVGDHLWQNNTYADIMIARLGGRWRDGLASGSFCWDLNDVPSIRSRWIGGRLVYVPS